ncbi:hypothetical protein GlitD10_1598 [Gloeomargarita lithophora Alchichica-D10]|uniref:Uncharacterized protein n=1 Tax=Gloeomargarita lithophora Alchichica-D10 TaxID=1188229 RepID=A0A1J0ADA7_9CYAN|nr:hypothetical protein [Gloeomargarita lithophora]APB33922.1 hypothetical protein GlitD10_1598 [Gloeomargarita lithophora Alchichica-D10]
MTQLLYTTQNQVQIYVETGRKSACDFVVKYREPRKRIRTPKHIHLMVDLFAKRAGNQQLCNAFVNHIINNIIQVVAPTSQFPPTLQVFALSHSTTFNLLDQYGDYSTEFFLIIVELIMIQEKTNYPNGKMNLQLFQQFRNNADIFTIVSKATFR